MIDAIEERFRRVQTVVTRAAVVPLLVRAGVFLCAMLAMVVAYPAPLLAGRLVGLLVLVAVLPAAAPRGRGPTAAVLVAVGGWLLDTTWYGQPAALGRLLALATLLYLVHSMSALAAALPYDAVVALDVVRHWLAWASAVVLASAVLTVLVRTATGTDRQTGVALLTVAGFAAAAALAALLMWLVRRP